MKRDIQYHMVLGYIPEHSQTTLLRGGGGEGVKIPSGDGNIPNWRFRPNVRLPGDLGRIHKGERRSSTIPYDRG